MILPTLRRRQDAAADGRPWRALSVRRGLATALVAGLLATLGLAGGGAATAGTALTNARVIRWVDGDTVSTSAGTVRLIGIDTPEKGSCGYGAATRHAQSIVPAGARIRLGNPSSVVDRDAYGRKLRYVQTLTGRDLGLAQVRDGAAARYDGRDGKQWHPLQSTYRRADANQPGYTCAGSTTDTSGTGGTAASATGECPASAPIKGNASSMIYHRPGQQYYDVTVAEECFATATQAEAAGYRAASV